MTDLPAGDASSALVIINPVAGPNAQRTLERDRLRRALEKAGLPSEWEETTPERDADDIIRESPADGVVVVIGGDGTVQAAARALIGTERPMTIVPRGSGNVFAQHLDLSPRLGPALSLARKGRVKRVDVGSLGGEPFLLGVGMGIDARVVREADRQLKRHVGPLAYWVSVAKNLPVRHHDFELEIDGESTAERGVSVMVANFGTRIGPFVYPEGARGDDGTLDVAVMKAENVEQVVGLLGNPVLPKGMADKGVRIYRARHVRVKADEAMAVQVDGEDQGDHHEFVCGLHDRALSVMVPRRDDD